MRLWLACFALCACARSSTEAPPKIAADPAQAEPPQVDAATSPVPSATASATQAPKTAAKSVSCTSDDECAPDSACHPTVCGARGDAGTSTCAKSVAPLAHCICGSNRCTLMRTFPASGAAVTGCATDAECRFDAPTGTCAAGVAAKLVPDRGGWCSCNAGTCTPELVEAVPCKSSIDCSWLEAPRRPAPASKVPRPYPPVVPCKTASFDSVCVAEQCVIRAWKC